MSTLIQPSFQKKKKKKNAQEVRISPPSATPFKVYLKLFFRENLNISEGWGITDYSNKSLQEVETFCHLLKEHLKDALHADISEINMKRTAPKGQWEKKIKTPSEQLQTLQVNFPDVNPPLVFSRLPN